MAVLATPVLAHGADKQWLRFGTTNQWWDTSSNWSPAGQPTTGDNALLVGTGTANTSVIHYNSYATLPTLNSLTLDQTGGGRVDFRQHEWNVSDFRATNVYAGLNGVGGYDHRAGTSYLTNVYLGYGNGGSGSYSLVNGSTTAASVANIDNLYLGSVAGSYGSFNVWNAYAGNPEVTLNAGMISVGGAGEGWFSQSGTVNASAIEINSTATSGNGADPLAIYGFYSGALTAGSVDVGEGGYGQFAVSTASSSYSPGTVTINGDIRLGYLGAGRGHLDLSGGHALTARDLRANNKGYGRVTQRDTSTANFRAVYLSSFSDTQSHYLLRDNASLQVTSQTVIGEAKKATFEQIGGTHDLTAGGATGMLRLGTGVNGDGTYLLRNSTNLTATALKAHTIRVGEAGTGAFRHDGGQITATDVYLGYGAGGTGTWTVEGEGNYSGDATYATRLTADNLYVGFDGNGTFNQTTTEDNYVVANRLVVAANPGSTGTYNLAGGRLMFHGGTDRLLQNNGTFNHTGGTLQGVTSLVNTGTFNHTGGGSLVVGALTNTGIFNSTRLLSVAGDATNAAGATLRSDGSSFFVNGTFTNNGAFVTSGTAVPSTATNSFRNLHVGETGHIVAGAGDRIIVNDKFLSTSTQAELWDTDEALLLFSDFNPDTATTFQLSVNGQDLGRSAEGFEDNFAWALVLVDLGDGLTLLDGDATAGGALYTRGFSIYNEGVEALSRINSNGLNIYYDPMDQESLWLDGQTYALNGGGSLIPVPEPGSLALLGLAAPLLAARRRRS